MNRLLDRAGFDELLKSLASRGYTIIGPTVREEAIVYDEIRSAADLPEGIGDEQAPGSYRLRKRQDKALFGYAVGPHSWKKFLFPAELRLLTATRAGGSVRFEPEPLPDTKYAFLGVRACELAALAIQDKVFVAGPYVDPRYEAVRSRLFLIAVQCVEAGGTCFCASMGAGPRVSKGFDLALTERPSRESSEFVVEAGSAQGEALLAELGARDCPPERRREAEAAVDHCAGTMRKAMPEGVKDLLYKNLEHPRWAEVASRCLSCANCTMACPTCFCSNVEETGDLSGDHAERWRRWDSCFTNDFSYLHGGSVRSNTRSKYRQWMTHKLATWHDQFGTSGCVGCGRCITWCPVGIDITEEAKAIAAAPAGKSAA